MTQLNSVPIFRARARTFWFAARFLPARDREPVQRLYTFARTIDDLVDQRPPSISSEQIRLTLEHWSAWLDEPSSPCNAPDPRLASQVLPLVRARGVPARYLQQLIAGVSSDLHPRTMACWPELRDYCIDVASSVGLAMCHILGAGEDPIARVAALELGIGMQLTNILRDLGEDLAVGRLYLPSDELTAHGSSAEHLHWLSERVIALGPSAIDRTFHELMRAQVARARDHYARGLEGVWRLPVDVQLAILLAGRLYAAILDVIEAANYDVFSQRPATSIRTKLGHLTNSWWMLHSRSARLQPAGAGS